MRGQKNVPVEFYLKSEKSHPDIFNNIEVDVIFTGPERDEWKVPAFWAGGDLFGVRFSAPEPGRYTWVSLCSDTKETGLHSRTGEAEVVPYEGANPLFKHGRVRCARTKRTFEHSDGTPFFWLADTWWMGLCKRLGWPEDIRMLAADRISKNFSVIQVVAGLYPDMPAFDQRGANEAGFPWEKDYARINPAYFDMADLRLEWLVRAGLVPCIVGCWAYFLPWMGIEKMKKHWRNIVARYGAYPVVWCLAGEGAMPYYLSKDKEKDIEVQKKGWTELARYVRSIDPFHNLITIHPTNNARDQVEDPSVLDFEMMQTGHSDRQSLGNTVTSVTDAYKREPVMPVLVGEVCYEGIGEACRQEVQRLMFWASVLNGSCGHTYGANGVWQVNTKGKPYGPSPHGMSYGNVAWEDAYQLPGSGQLGLAKKFLERFEWWRFEPHPEWVKPAWTKENPCAPYAAGIPGEARVVYSPLPWGVPEVRGLEIGVRYKSALFNPVNGEITDIGPVNADENGDWVPPLGNDPWRVMPVFQDWVIFLERIR
ncbi:hypothetical protein COS16_06405 [Candidatus Desantisbacteria bacterium CG02_land_8_20_14_3_00_49_13]|nr:MAG: hypothetical protein AUJ67_04850 [Candidatus Desantisbacteria bacterium CG1_02_49_89]PIV55662.1 MAG: hypothetical protein COS16_06405 [Candidatus Desantisbacteria bacterium CG02_land_8_20_14_3_00_49_13]PJB27833.1 MAG: hypothetical protein CO111_03150 [Candidatus Desantisbacteria bacterium CG_4_9_14_3_um_filter_50_7]